MKAELTESGTDSLAQAYIFFIKVAWNCPEDTRQDR